MLIFSGGLVAMSLHEIAFSGGKAGNTTGGILSLASQAISLCDVR